MSEILIVDDDRKIIRMLTRRLKKAGYTIHTAENGQIGVEKAVELTPDLILMDMHMPVMNGYEATQTLRQQGFTGLIVAITASAMADDTQKSIQAGCDYFIAKPIDTEFEVRIKELLGGHK
jgi:CheY-like chemotaxis protein